MGMKEDSIARAMMDRDEGETEGDGFDSPEAFRAAWNLIANSEQ